MDKSKILKLIEELEKEMEKDFKENFELRDEMTSQFKDFKELNSNYTPESDSENTAREVWYLRGIEEVKNLLD